MGLLWEFVVKTVVNGVALWLAATVVAGIHFGQSPEWTGTATTVAVVAVVFGLLNTVIKPVLKFFTLPLIWLTLGLFSLVINALMLQLTSWLAGQLGLAFRVDRFFWDAVLGALVVTVVSILLSAVIPDPARRR